MLNQAQNSWVDCELAASSGQGVSPRRPDPLPASQFWLNLLVLLPVLWAQSLVNYLHSELISPARMLPTIKSECLADWKVELGLDALSVRRGTLVAHRAVARSRPFPAGAGTGVRHGKNVREMAKFLSGIAASDHVLWLVTFTATMSRFARVFRPLALIRFLRFGRLRSPGSRRREA